MPALSATSRRFVLSLVVGAALVPHTIACAGNTVPRSEVTLAAMEGHVDAKIELDARTQASKVTLDGLWAAPSKQASGDEIPPLDECPSLPADTRVTARGQSLSLSHGGWQEYRSGGCNGSASETTYTCAAPTVTVPWNAGAAITVKQGNRTWTIELADAPRATQARFSSVPVHDEGVADLTLTPRVPNGTAVIGTVSLSDCRGLVWDVSPNFAPTPLGVKAIIPLVHAPPRTCSAGADAGAPRAHADAGAANDASVDAYADADAADAGDAGDGGDADIEADADVDVTEAPRPGLNIAASLRVRFPTHVLRCDGPRTCRLNGDATVSLYASAPFIANERGAVVR